MIQPDANVLVIIVARIGDTLLATPALRALKGAIPRGQLTVLAHPKRVEVLEHLPFIDVLEGITKISVQVKGWIGKKPHDFALVYGRDEALVRYALRASDRVIAFRQRDPVLNARLAHLVEEPSVPQHAVLHRLSLLTPLGLTASDLRLAYCVTAEECAWARRWLAAQVPAGRPLVGLQIASFPTKAHRDWPVASFQELIGRIAAAHAHARFLLLGDAAAAKKAAALLCAYPQQVALAAGRVRLRQSAALMSELDLYVGVDTGPTHIAGALALPMVALYHSAYPGRNLVPLQHPACIMIEHPLTGASASITAAMGDIPVEKVSAAALGLLRQGRRGEI